MTKPLVVILAGGEGKRFSPLVTNKTIFPFLGKPLLQHQLEQLARVGFEEVLIATNSENQTWLDNNSFKKIKIRTKQQATPTGMADAILELKDEIGDQPMLVMNAVDVVADGLFIQLLEKIEQNQPAGLIAGRKIKNYFPGGYLELDGDQVVGIVEKPGAGNEPSDFLNLVFHYFADPKNFIEALKNTHSKEDDVYEVALTEILKKEKFNLVSYDGFWRKLKYPHMVLDVTEIMLENYLDSFVAESAVVDKNATVEGRVYLGENVQVQAGAVIKGPAYIGDNSIVGVGSLVRQSIIENDAIVGFGCEVARSYVGPGCKLHNNFVGDSVFEADINPSYGTVTTNWRLDQGEIKLKTVDGSVETGRTKLGAVLAKGVFSGVNTIFLPGVTVGADSQIYPGTIVHSALPAKSILKTYQEQQGG